MYFLLTKLKVRYTLVIYVGQFQRRLDETFFQVQNENDEQSMFASRVMPTKVECSRNLSVNTSMNESVFSSIPNNLICHPLALKL